MKENQYKQPEELILDYEPLELPKSNQHYFELVILFVVSLFAAFLLFLFDKETNGVADLLTKPMLISALIYAVPAFVTSAFLFEKLVQSYGKKMSLVISLLVSIPLAFLMIMWFL